MDELIAEGTLRRCSHCFGMYDAGMQLPPVDIAVDGIAMAHHLCPQCTTLYTSPERRLGHICPLCEEHESLFFRPTPGEDLSDVDGWNGRPRKYLSEDVFGALLEVMNGRTEFVDDRTRMHPKHERDTVFGRDRTFCFFCSNHPRNECFFYCIDCHVSVCEECVVLFPHRGHHVKYCENGVGFVQKDVHKIMTGLVDLMQEGTQEEILEREYLCAFDQHVKGIKDDVEETFHSIRETLEDVKQRILVSVDETANDIVGSVKLTRKTLNKIFEGARSGLLIGESFLKKKDNDIDTMMQISMFREKISELEKAARFFAAERLPKGGNVGLSWDGKKDIEQIKALIEGLNSFVQMRPLSLFAQNTTCSTITIRWIFPSSDVSGLITIEHDSGKDLPKWDPVVADFEGECFKVENLEPNKAHRFRVKYRCGVNESPFCLATFKTPPIVAPTLQAELCADHGIILVTDFTKEEWPAMLFLSYQVEVAQTPSTATVAPNSLKYERIYQGPNNRAKFPDAQGGMTYRFRSRGVAGKHLGPWSNIAVLKVEK